MNDLYIWIWTDLVSGETGLIPLPGPKKGDVAIPAMTASRPSDPDVDKILEGIIKLVRASNENVTISLVKYSQSEVIKTWTPVTLSEPSRSKN